MIAKNHASVIMANYGRKKNNVCALMGTRYVILLKLRNVIFTPFPRHFLLGV